MLEICRTCLQETPTTNCVSLKKYVESLQIRSKLAVCIPELNLNLVDNLVLCMPCNNSLDSAYEFINNCQRNEELVRACMQNGDSVSLFDIYKMQGNGIKPEFVQICRTCLKEIPSIGSITVMDDTKLLQIKTELAVCIPELSLNVVIDPVFCISCINQLHSAYNFIKQCQQNEDRIRSGRQNKLDGNSFIFMDILNEYKCVKLNGDENCVGLVANPGIVKSDLKYLNNLLDDSFCDIENYYRENAVKEEQAVIKGEGALIKTEESSTENDIYAINKFELHTRGNHENNLKIPENFDKTILECFVRLTKLPDNFLMELKENNFINCSKKIKSPFNCNFCDFTTIVKKNLKNHIVNTHRREGNKLFKCDECDYSAAEKHLFDHMRIYRGEKSYICNVCKFCCRTRWGLIYHMRSHSDRKVFLCHLCAFNTGYKTKLAEHMKTHSGEKIFKCNVCTYKTTKKSELLAHCIEKRFKCTTCEYQTTHKQYLKMHMRRHSTIEKCFTCNLCEFRTAYKLSLKYHVSRTHSHKYAKPFVCSFCEYSTSAKVYLDMHMRNHSDEKPFHCTLCDYSAVYKCRLVQHIRSHNKEKIYACNKCKFSTKHTNCLKNHMIVHNRERLFTCGKCDHRALRKGDLIKHMKVHSDVKPFICVICNEFSTATKVSLWRHIKTVHEKEKPYVCNVCSARYSTKVCLQEHMRTHTGEKPYVCTKCDYSSGRKNTLRRHMKMHDRKTDLTCSLCKFVATGKIYLTAHMKTHNSEKRLVCPICHYSSILSANLKSHMKSHSKNK